ncbi:MAG: hypothetical protein ACE5EH_12865 [Gammaproteobacteria bacterium]
MRLLIGQGNSPTSDDFQRYLPGPGAGGGGGSIAGADVSFSSPWSNENGTGSAALEVGVYSPQIGGGGGYTWTTQQIIDFFTRVFEEKQ